MHRRRLATIASLSLGSALLIAPAARSIGELAAADNSVAYFGAAEVKAAFAKGAVPVRLFSFSLPGVARVGDTTLIVPGPFHQPADQLISARGPGLLRKLTSSVTMNCRNL